MIPTLWLRRKTESRWTRRTTWTPLLLNQRQLQRVLAKERTRADRNASVFGLIILRIVDMRDVRHSAVKLAKILHRRLRDTDEKGHLNYGRIGVVLPATDDEGTEFVLADILRLASAAKLNIEGEAFVYPERPRRAEDRLGDPDSEAAREDSTSPEVASGHQAVDSPPGRATVLPIAMCIAPYPLWKRSLDIIGAGVGLIVAVPIIALSAAIIRSTSRGPGFFAQERVGYLGQRFSIYKLRTMVDNAEELKPALLACNERDGPAFKMHDDPRITRFGRLLRSTGLDELPQLVNVLAGDMSLVGPRPLPIAEAEQCTAWQRARLNTKPGLTCFWQLAKSRKMSFVEWMRLDIRYARARNLWLDAKLILNTFLAVILGRVGH